MHKKLMGHSAILCAALLLASQQGLAQQAPKPKYQEGIHYTAIENAPDLSSEKISVTEAFSYMCTHCATFEPYIQSWQQRKPEFVDFKRVPVVFGRGSWELYARAYVTAEVMGIAGESHSAMMDRIWKDREVSRTIEELAQFYAAYGVDPNTFVATSKSFAVDARMRKDQRWVQTSGVRGTPTLVVADRYVVAGNDAVPNYDAMLDVVNFLVDSERSEQVAAAAAASEAIEEEVAEDVSLDDNGSGSGN